MKPTQTNDENERKNKDVPQNCSYDLLRNNEGELVLLIDMQDSQPEKPRIVYDGTSQMILYRNPYQAFTLNHISDEAREALSQSHKLMIVEWGSEDKRLEYEVEIKQVTSLDSIL